MNNELRIIVAGGRDFNDYGLLKFELERFLNRHPERDIKIISGKAKGADSLGERFAHEVGLEVKEFPANWDEFGQLAGSIRNREMAKYATSGAGEGVLFAFWDGKSKGTKNMIDAANKYGLAMRIVGY